MNESSVVAVVPAAGVGRRMGGEIPKQYLELNGRTVLEHTLWRLADHPEIKRVVVAIAADDAHYANLTKRLPTNVSTVTGGAERCHSVLAALDAVEREAQASDWIMVHDAARPCLRTGDISAMIAALATHEVGGILAVPARDTLKRCDAQGNIDDTLERAGLWHALTPQMFRYGVLRSAIQAALSEGKLVTDEAQAIEQAGFVPRVIAGHGDNIKITQPEDLALASMILQAQQTSKEGAAQ